MHAKMIWKWLVFTLNASLHLHCIEPPWQAGKVAPQPEAAKEALHRLNAMLNYWCQFCLFPGWCQGNYGCSDPGHFLWIVAEKPVLRGTFCHPFLSNLCSCALARWPQTQSLWAEMPRRRITRWGMRWDSLASDGFGDCTSGFQWHDMLIWDDLGIFCRTSRRDDIRINEWLEFPVRNSKIE